MIRGGLFTNEILASALSAREAAENKKGEQVVVLDMTDVTLIADYFVIVTALNLTHVESVADAVQEALEARGLVRLNPQAGSRGHWVLLDYGAVVVHIFTEAERAYYGLERLWGDARLVVDSALQER